ncbi:hypothetical protein HDU98_006366 [Podochytrium sp. JEL0797]|nr:hypothetical protein HDU98_006366 [Podochytrium sp. JEL0797]
MAPLLAKVRECTGNTHSLVATWKTSSSPPSPDPFTLKMTSLSSASPDPFTLTLPLTRDALESVFDCSQPATTLVRPGLVVWWHFYSTTATPLAGNCFFSFKFLHSNIYVGNLHSDKIDLTETLRTYAPAMHRDFLANRPVKVTLSVNFVNRLNMGSIQSAILVHQRLRPEERVAALYKAALDRLPADDVFIAAEPKPCAPQPHAHANVVEPETRAPHAPMNANSLDLHPTEPAPHAQSTPDVDMYTQPNSVSISDDDLIAALIFERADSNSTTTGESVAVKSGSDPIPATAIVATPTFDLVNVGAVNVGVGGPCSSDAHKPIPETHGGELATFVMGMEADGLERGSSDLGCASGMVVANPSASVDGSPHPSCDNIAFLAAVTVESAPLSPLPLPSVKAVVEPQTPNVSQVNAAPIPISAPVAAIPPRLDWKSCTDTTILQTLLLESCARAPRTSATASPNTPTNDDISVGDSVVSFICPLSLKRVKHPARGRKCKHKQAFDAEIFLAFNENEDTWKCVVCNHQIDQSDLLLDTDMLRLLHKYPHADKCIIQSTGQDAPFTDAIPDVDKTPQSAPPKRQRPISEVILIDSDSDSEEPMAKRRIFSPVVEYVTERSVLESGKVVETIVID